LKIPRPSVTINFLDGNFLDGNFLDGNFLDGNFLDGNFLGSGVISVRRRLEYRRRALRGGQNPAEAGTPNASLLAQVAN